MFLQQLLDVSHAPRVAAVVPHAVPDHDGSGIIPDAVGVNVEGRGDAERGKQRKKPCQHPCTVFCSVPYYYDAKKYPLSVRTAQFNNTK